MATDLMSGYVAYTNAPDILAEAQSSIPGPGEKSISITVSVTVSLTATA